ncbi:MAG: aldose 1-epimerase family protein [Fusicatenibacter sp.]|nr:aldose 1-epimerase family protein [Fusicatenibacter sp.]
MRTMENGKLRVAISDHGAELCSIYDKEEGREAVWTADPAFWNRHAPVLFPFVGKVNGGFYTHKGVKYPMGQHGFARDKEFECLENTAERTVHRLVSDEETKKVYPFDFALTITQELQGRTLTVNWQVENTGDEMLYFSIGGHPAFLIPEQYEITFNQGLENHGEDTLCYCLIDPETSGVDFANPHTLRLEEGKISYDRHLFDQDALIFDEYQVERVGIEADGKKLVTLTCKGFPSVGVWSKPKADAPFVCLEPWIGRCDNVGFDGELKEKYKEQHLEPGKVFLASYAITVGE